MKKSWKILIIVLAVLGVMAVTCPGRQRHIDAQLKFMSKALNKQVKSLEKSYKAEFNQEMEDEGKMTVSVGFLGMVFLTNKKEFKTNVNLN